MTRWKAICAYDGTEFAGWQSQTAGNAVQNIIESALGSILREPVRIHGASRTDAGVHAHGQCFHFDHPWRHDGSALLRAANTKLPASIRLTTVEPTDESFHARFSNHGKRYEYRFSERPADPFTIRYCWHIPGDFDQKKMESTLPAFAGTHDFTAFAGRVHETENSVKTLKSLKLVPRESGEWILRVEGTGFLYRMVRSIAATAVRVATGRLPPSRISELLLEKKRTPEVHTAPACGLFLDEIFYD